MYYWDGSTGCSKSRDKHGYFRTRGSRGVYLRVFGLHHVVLGFPKAESGKAGIERVVCGGKRAYLCDMYQWEIDVLVYDGFR